MKTKSISIVKEKMSNEKRVILLPRQVKNLVEHGYRVLVEHNAGIHLDKDDKEYIAAGAIIVSEEDAWTKSNIIIKYKAPIESEYKYFRKELIILALFHAEGNPKLLKTLIEKKVTAYSFEFVKNSSGMFPLGIPGGNIAGRIGFLYGMFYLQNNFGAKGILLSKVNNVKAPKVAVIGYGNVGKSVIDMALSLGNEVVVFGTNKKHMQAVSLELNNKAKFYCCNKENLLRELSDIDLLVGAILISTYETKAIIDDEIFDIIPKGTVIVDITCGYGNGYIPQIKGYTDESYPYQIIDGKICIKIDHLPKLYHRTTVEAYSEAVLPYVLKILNKDNNPLELGQIISKGKIVNSEIMRHWKYYERNRLFL